MQNSVHVCFKMDTNATVNLPKCIWYSNMYRVCWVASLSGTIHMCLSCWMVQQWLHRYRNILSVYLSLSWFIIFGVFFSEPPQNVTLTATGSDRLEFRWEPPPHNIHRQFATLYIVFFQNEAHFVNASSNLVMQLESLTPYTTYNCCVAANTTSGPSRLACTSQTTLRTGSYSQVAS